MNKQTCYAYTKPSSERRVMHVYTATDTGWSSVYEAVLVLLHEHTAIDVDAYVTTRKLQSAKPRPDYERQLLDGRWVATRERLLGDGGVVSIRTDITAQKLAWADGVKHAN